MKIINPRLIATRRREQRYTQTQLALLVGCTQQYISLIESGRAGGCDPRIAAGICHRLGLDVNQAFDPNSDRTFTTSPVVNNAVITQKAS